MKSQPVRRTALDGAVTFRPIQPDDEGFLYRVYASTRAEELAPLGWSEAEREAFLALQFKAQHTFYQEQFGQAEFLLVLWQDRPIGRLYLDRRQDEIRIIDIALLPDQRNRGIGSALLKDILAEGQQAGLPVRIHVERYNPALRLYSRLGFRQIDEHGVYYLMERQPDPA